jgi:hypothetical protein
VRLFRSSGEYLIASGVLFAIAGLEIYRAGRGATRQHHSTLGACASILVTICVVSYMGAIMSRTSVRAEKAALVIIQIWCAESIMRYLSWLGVGWATIPNERWLSAASACTVAIVSALCTFRVFRDRHAEGARTS